MDTSDIIALSAAGLSVIGTFYAIYNANSARKQADLAEEQADEAKRSADAAWAQLRLSQEDYSRRQLETLHDAFGATIRSARGYHRSLMKLFFEGIQPYDPRPIYKNFMSHLPAYQVLEGYLPPSSELRHDLKELDLISASLGGVAALALSEGRKGLTLEGNSFAYEELQRFDRAIDRLQGTGGRFFTHEFRRLAEQGKDDPT